MRFHNTGTKRLHHPAVGDLDLTYEAFELTTDSGPIDAARRPAEMLLEQRQRYEGVRDPALCQDPKACSRDVELLHSIIWQEIFDSRTVATRYAWFPGTYWATWPLAAHYGTANEPASCSVSSSREFCSWAKRLGPKISAIRSWAAPASA